MRFALSFVAATVLATAAQAAPLQSRPISADGATAAKLTAQQEALRERMGQRQLDLLIASIVETDRPQAEAKRAEATRSASN